MARKVKYFVGIDDTDNEISRGTGFRARHLSSLIIEENLGTAISVTRHQLFFHPSVPYTSQNSSACIEVETDNIKELKKFCKAYLKCESAEGSDVGLCIAEIDSIPDSVIDWGKRAKKELLTQKEAIELATEANIYLEGFLGSLDGIIGALAAVGLRQSGNDGRFIWLEGKELRDFSGIYTAKELFELSNFDEIKSKENNFVKQDEKINVDEWIRPVLTNNKITLIVEPSLNNQNYEWQIASKEYIKSISN